MLSHDLPVQVLLQERSCPLRKKQMKSEWLVSTSSLTRYCVLVMGPNDAKKYGPHAELFFFYCRT